MDNWPTAINSFALVTYLPSPLGGFFDELRRELIPNSAPRAHVTILPPRPLFDPPREAWRAILAGIAGLRPFEVEAAEVAVFRNTNVIYVEIGAGRRELERLHGTLNTGPLQFDEPFDYHPHITLAQEIGATEVPALWERARERWASFEGPRRFQLETLTLVQNMAPDKWRDLAQHTLASARARSVK